MSAIVSPQLHSHFATSNKQHSHHYPFPDASHDGASYSGLASDGASFDLATIHPSHGINPVTGSYNDQSGDADGMSEAQKILAAMAACGTEDDIEAEADNFVDDDGLETSSDSTLDTPLNTTPAEGHDYHKSQQIGPYSHSSGSLTPSHGLERVSSCYFGLPPRSEQLSENGVPFDTALVRQLSSTPCTPSIYSRDNETPVAILASNSAAAAAGPASAMPSFNAISFSLAPSLSSSSSMTRSYSAPAPTQAQWNALQQKWNAEAQLAAPSASFEQNELCQASTSTSAPSPSPRPRIARRNTSAHIPSLRRQREQEDTIEADSESAIPGIHDTFSSRAHLLNPAHKHNPFKRSRLSFTAIAEDPYRESSLYASPSPPPSTCSLAHIPERQSSPPKSPTRPSLNRSFTTPEFYADQA